MILLGVIGEYLSKIYMEVKNRPIYIVKNVFTFSYEEKDIKSENE